MGDLAADDAQLALALRDALRTLLLPLEPSLEEAAVRAVVEALEGMGVERGDQPIHIRSTHDSWRTGLGRSTSLTAAIQTALRAGNGPIGAKFAARYFTMHEDTLQGRHLYAFEEASSFLSHLRLAVRLADDESMSAAQISKVLDARDHRVGFGWRAVRDVLRPLGFTFRLDQEHVDNLFARDAELEESVFADADFYEAAAIVGLAASELSFPGDLEALLLRLFSPTSTRLRHGPYLQILHYLVTIAEFYDHALKVLYEFEPRGNVAKSIFNSYPIDLRASENPVLNNAKSVDVLDSGWARSKREHLPASTALYEIIDGLEQLGFAARKDLAAWVRRWLLRIVRLTRDVAHTVPDPPADREITSLIAAVGRGPTNTFGVLEQRLMDALTLHQHPAAEGWSSHGIGDSVNASNVSRKKIGDAEFQNVAAAAVVAYESHAGRLTDVYVDGHVETLKRVIPQRAGEWERVSPRAEWQLQVRFLAHEVDVEESEVDIEGFTVRLTAMSFADFCEDAPPVGRLRATYHEHVTRRLNEARTPQAVREKYLALLA